MAAREAAMDDDIHLIEEIEKNPLIWDNRLPDYRNKKSKEVIYMHMAEKLGKDAKDVEYRWRNLRSSNVRKRCTIGRSGDAASPAWPLYKFLTFLAPTVRHRQTMNNQSSQEMLSGPFPAESDRLEVRDEEDICCSPVPLYPSDISMHSAITPPPPKKTKSTRKEIDSEFLKLLKETRAVEEEDDNSHFFQSLIPFCREMTPCQKLEYRKKVLDLTLDIVKNNTKK